MTGTLLTTSQAATRLGVTPCRVRQLITEGRLPATKRGWRWVIREDDLELVKERPTGRPKRGQSPYRIVTEGQVSTEPGTKVVYFIPPRPSQERDEPSR